MPNSPVYGFSYPALSDPPNGPSQLATLVGQLEAKIITMDAVLNAQITSRYSGSSAPGTDQVIGTSETIMDEKVTLSAVSGHRYVILHTGDYAVASGSPTAQTFIYRYAAGASLTTAGTSIQTFIGPPPSGGHQTDTRHTIWTAPSTGTFTLGCGYFTNGGATVRHYANSKRLTVFDIT